MGFIIQLTTIGIIIAVIIGLFIHHAFTHDGQFFSTDDFSNAIVNLLKSHEGVIILLLLILMGVLI